MKPVFACNLAFALLFATFSLMPPLTAAEQPKVGDQAPDFALSTLDGRSVQLNKLTASSNVVLVVLRGWPGYQCPICDRQVQNFIKAAPAFAEAKARVVFVYPGPAKNLKTHAAEFAAAKGKQWPADFHFVLDPDYTLVNAYGLRWDAPKETADPSTFVIDQKGTVRFQKIAHSHGGRTKAEDIIAELKKLTRD